MKESPKQPSLCLWPFLGRSILIYHLPYNKFLFKTRFWWEGVEVRQKRKKGCISWLVARFFNSYLEDILCLKNFTRLPKQIKYRKAIKSNYEIKVDQ